MKQLILIACALMLSACGTTGTTNAGLLGQEIPKKHSRLIISRDTSLLYMAGSADVSLNGEKIASLARGASVVKDTPAGKNRLQVSTPTALGQYVVTFETKPQKSYNFEVSPRGENLMGGYGLGLIGDAIKANVSEKSGYFKINPKGDEK